ncbi:hypothetical protein M5K25_000877 [Dendrobium thyrsiflorum]|uniref:Leucine-rich repeat-containing N-terminal plant-type domain-containing protein n=1 Tax=Dendrobium thyrsiflorum TaxID=117978 RepID=A0ABD0W937_DENTH
MVDSLLGNGLLTMRIPIRVFVIGQCLQTERSALLQLKRGFTFFKLNTWIPGTNCCLWESVICDEWRVIGLDLRGQDIEGTIDPSLFNLTSLCTLDFSYNRFNGKSIPDSGWDQLANLSRLDLSNSGFVGKVPIGITRLTKLTVINLSFNYYEFKYLSFTIKPTFLQNMSSLRELYLDNVDLSTYGNEWCSALINSTMILEVLSMSGCSLFGFCPKQIFLLRNLRKLDISKNPKLYGSLPNFSVDNNLHFFVLSYTNFSGKLPDTIGNLKFLRQLDLSSCQFSGRLPPSMRNLSLLETLDLSNNNKLQGPIPGSLFQLSRLSLIFLASNNFSEVMELELIKDHKDLFSLDLSNNALSLSSWKANEGSSPSDYPRLAILALASCNLTKIPAFLKYHHNIGTLDLSNNKIHGEIPSWIWNIGN